MARWARSLRAGLLAVYALASAAPLHAAVVLQYHHVSDATPPSTSTSPGRFAMHLDLLQEAGFAVVSLQSLVDIMESGGPLPDKTAAITFDDGYLSVYTTAWPLLREKGFPFTVFVNSEPHDRRSPQFMSWEQLREMHAAGATIANHSVNHPHLLERQAGQDAGEWRAWVESEISAAQSRIRTEIGEAAPLFAYPFGEFDRELAGIVGDLGYAGFGQQSGPLAAFSDVRAIPRFPFGGSYGDRDDFLTKLNSLPFPLAAGADALGLQGEDGAALADSVLDTPARPVLVLRLAEGFDPARVGCFVSGQGRARVRVENSSVLVQAEQALPPGRSRYNCTLPSGRQGRFYWYSQPWIIRQEK